jgi:aminoglycoside phosphotransferase (APT) family kinase protein
VRVPICWYGALSNDATEFTLILADLAPRRPGRQVDGCSRDQAANAVRNLAALHASRWNDPSLREIDFLIPLTKERAEFLGQLGSTATEQFIARFASRLADAEVATLRDVADALVDWPLSRPEPVAVMHGDYRLDNLMFPPVGDDVVAVDWQTVTAGLPARDLSYLLGTSLRLEDRRVAKDAIVGS